MDVTTEPTTEQYLQKEDNGLVKPSAEWRRRRRTHHLQKENSYEPNDKSHYNPVDLQMIIKTLFTWSQELADISSQKQEINY